MSTIKVNNVIPPNASEGVTIDGLQMPTAGPLSNRNLIINGRFRVDQRYNGNAVTMQSGYTVDRFRVHGPTANQFTVDQQTTGVRVTCAAVGAFGHFGTPLEQQDLLPYLGQKMTISFKVRGSTSISQTLDFNDMPTPTSGTAISLDSSTYNVTTSWQTVTRTFTMPSSLSYACVYVSLLQVNSSNMAVNDWVELDEVQLEAGEKNTPFEHRSYSDELAKCQRYCYRLDVAPGYHFINTMSYNVNLVFGSIDLPVQMRARPTLMTPFGVAADYQITSWSAQDLCTSLPALNGSTTSSVQVQFTSTGNVNTGYATMGSAVDNPIYLIFDGGSEL